MLIKLDYKPVSINVVWQGQRFKTKIYKVYERDLSKLLMIYQKPPQTENIKITYKFYQKALFRGDVDNLIKPLQDILVKNGFMKDDRYITEMHIYKIKSDTDYMEIEIENSTS